jgi:hypothetical protein
VAGAAEREATIVKAKQILAADSLLLALLTTGAAGFGVVKAVDDNKSDGS